MTDTEATPVAADDTAVSEAPAPSNDTPASETAEVTSRQAIERAFAKVDEANAEPKPVEPVADLEDEAKAAAKPDAERDENGRFKAKDKAPDAEPVKDTKTEEDSAESGQADAKTETFKEPPQRFSADAKNAWADAPVPVRAEIDRAIKELEGGIEQHRTAFEPYRAFDAELKQRGQNFEQVLGHYRGIENMLAQDPMRGLDQICHNLGTSLREVAAKVTGQTPDQSAASQDRVINELRQEIAGLKQGLNGVSATIQTKEQAQITQQITDFAADKPRFDELSNDMAKMLDSGMAKDLQDAYQKAERLNPAPAQDAPVAVAETEPKPERNQTRKSNISLSGAPASGSNPGSKPSGSTRQALDNAFAAAGL